MGNSFRVGRSGSESCVFWIPQGLVELHHRALAFAIDLHLELGARRRAVGAYDAERDRLLDSVSVMPRR